jgi:hypothetical protein
MRRIRRAVLTTGKRSEARDSFLEAAVRQARRSASWAASKYILAERQSFSGSGGLSHLLPGYRSVENGTHRAEIARIWRSVLTLARCRAGDLSTHPEAPRPDGGPAQTLRHMGTEERASFAAAAPRASYPRGSLA